MFHDQTILITGGTGSWGQELTRKLLESKPKQIRIFSRNEFTQVQMQRVFPNHESLKFIIGDVRDELAVDAACRNVDYVFHLAALKHVPICESQPEEALKTNVQGTENVIRASIRHRVKKVIDVSTDKAVDPINFYGMTKAFGEKLVLRANDLSDTTRFVCIRGGNVLGTNGSVVPFFKSCVLRGDDLPITSKEMTRFFLTISEAIDLLLSAARVAIGGETFVMQMNACRIVDVANVLIKRLAKKEIKLKEVGIRPGEKLHEVLVSAHESPYTYRYSEQYFVILPSHASTELNDRYSHLPKTESVEYASNDKLMTDSEIEAMLEKGGFLC
ncbi:polysaccharide biosynthesis protein [Cohnella thailandensis]|uniref:Polysaccharide biosynthesis protein n=1 Tax=Cohnella thailandensis TaxID=557557 RepID=A0A841T3I8_9BACL|nr:polysaccharide biosynthesis protein [Cohnella thailandensis]MBB6635671.1 polysaccharide biosynthesis protein [Cohnella thailandensis]MBP1976048.1 FlaA1/EpsC-like NDP-sugar epimerase [Cohnella thailandensis]